MIKLASVQSIYIATALTLISACGKSAAPVVNPAPPVAPVAPAPVAYNPGNTVNGCVGTMANEMYVNFGGSYDTIREEAMPAYQCMYGQITLATAVSIGTTSIVAGSYSWQQIYDQITTAINSCNVYSSGSGSSIWASVNYGSFSGAYTTNSNASYLGTCSLVGNSSVTFQRPNIRSNFSGIFMEIANLNSRFYYVNNSANYYGPSYGNIYGSGTNVSVGLSYGSGGLNLAGAFSFNH